MYVLPNLNLDTVLRPYSKSKFELESNFSEILPVNCKFIRDSTPT